MTKVADTASHTTCLGHTPSGRCIPVGSMTGAELKERQNRWLACYKQRGEARRARLEAAEACCLDCAAALRTDPLDRARHHIGLAEKRAADASRAALRARRANNIATAILIPLSLLTLILAAIVLTNG